MLRMIRPGPNDEMSLRNPVQAFPEQARLSKHEGCRERVGFEQGFSWWTPARLALFMPFFVCLAGQSKNFLTKTLAISLKLCEKNRAGGMVLPRTNCLLCKEGMK